ncbi:MAG TPA: hypothetical protein PK916_12290 [Bacteroidota bacterium]|nr:hypothetical protein [Bacteroidota bacterium]
MGIRGCFTLLLLVCCLFPGAFAFAQDTVGVALEYDAGMAFTVSARTELRFDLVARDAQGNVYDQWDQHGHALRLGVDSSHAEADTSVRSWSADADGFSWLRLWLSDVPLAVDSVLSDAQNPRTFFTIPHALFVNGRATLRFAQSQAGRGITLSIAPILPQLSHSSLPITILPEKVDNLLLDITTPIQLGKDRVFYRRAFELMAWPRDRNLNTVSDTSIQVAFSARFADEFERSPAMSDIFLSPLHIQGATNFFISSSVSREVRKGQERQQVFAVCPDDTTIKGVTDPYEILDHPPNPFALLKPADGAILQLQDPTDITKFTWVKSQPQDPYTDVQTSRFNPATQSDIVTYTLRMFDGETMTRSKSFPADNGGVDASCSLTAQVLESTMDELSGMPNTMALRVIWRVEATDTLYVTESAPPHLDPLMRQGHTLHLLRGINNIGPALLESSFTLHPNFPNPFNPATVIPIDLPASGRCTIRVLDLLGTEVAVLHDGFLEAGSHRFTFDGRDLPSGVYTCRSSFNGVTRSHCMVLLR